MNIPSSYEGLCTNLIVDGKIITSHLEAVGKDKAWLMVELKKQNVYRLKDVLLAYLDTSGRFFIHLKKL